MMCILDGIWYLLMVYISSVVLSMSMDVVRRAEEVEVRYKKVKDEWV